MKAKRLHFGKLKFLQLPNKIKENSKQKKQTNKKWSNGAERKVPALAWRVFFLQKKKKRRQKKGILEARE